jgi:hypothetical protein
MKPRRRHGSAAAGATAVERQVRAPGVRLDASAAAASDTAAAVWLEVAYEGSFKGHWMGEFEFTRATFEQIVANLRSHPAFRAGADAAASTDIEAGAYDVVQWDMHHASEAPATSGEIPVVGAPAQGWVLDARIGQRADGKATLEALTRWLEPARTYVREKRYRWASVSVVFNAKHPETGTPIGAVLTSIAVTNQPFLQDLPALAASIYKSEWSPVEGRDGIIARLRAEFELDKTDPDDAIVAKVTELRRWAEPGATVPDGVDIEHALQTLRCIFNLPYLTPADAVFAEVDKLFTNPGTQNNAPAGAATEETMTTNATNTPAAQKSPADDLRDSLAITLAKHRKCDATSVTNTQILMAVETGANATTDLAALLQALDVASLPAALASIDTLKKVKIELDKLLPQFENAKQELAQIDEQGALEDVGMALASIGIAPNDESKAMVRTSLMNHRKADKAGFRKEYKIEEARQLARAQNAATVNATGGADPTAALATQRQHAQQRPASILDGLALGAGGVIQRSALQDKPGTGAQRVDLSTIPGRNDVEKAMNFVKSQPGGDKLDLDALHERACAALQSSRAA